MAGNAFFFDSFDHYSGSQFTTKWTSGTAGGAGTIITGRTGSGLQVVGSGPMKTLGGEYQELTYGSAYYTLGLANFIVRFQNLLNGITCELWHVGDGRLHVYYGAGGVSGTFGSNVSGPVIDTLQWYYVEFQASVTLSGNNLSFTTVVRINEDPVLTDSQTLTVYGPAFLGHVGFASIQLGGAGGGLYSIFDDLYVTDTEFLGDIKIQVIYPNAAGSSAQWTPSPAVPNWQNASEHPPDGDTSTNAAATTGLVDIYNLDDITGFTGTIKGAQMLVMTKKSDTGTGAIKGQVVTNGNTVEMPEFYPSNLSYIYSIQPYRQNPVTNADWTVSDINALQLGVKRTQ